MKKILVALALVALLGARARAATTFSISTATWITDSSQGTFVFNSVTFGELIGVQYGIHAVDGVTGSFCDRLYDFAIVPRNTMPTAAVIRAAIQADVTSRAPGAGLLACIALKNNELTRTRPLLNNSVSGVDGTAVTAP